MSRLIPPTEGVFISETSGRLLVYLLEKSPGTILRRDIIIHDVWDRYGCTGTGNSLNQYISLLRKNFSALGVGNVIETIPKQGFSLRYDLVVSTYSERVLTPIDKEVSNIPVEVVCNPIKTARAKLECYLLVSIIAIGCFLIFKYSPFTSNYIDSVKLYYIGNVNHCRFYTVNTFSDEFQKKRMETAIAVSSQEAPCIGNSFYIVDIENRYLFGGQGRVFISRCTFEKNVTDKISGCKDIYVEK